MTSDVIAGAALALSAVSLAWQLMRVRWERPVVVVRGGWVSQQNAGGPASWVLSVSVTNVGERAVTVDEPAWIIRRRFARPWTMFGSEDLQGPALPHRLEPFDVQRWTFAANDLPLEPGATGHPAVAIVRRRLRASRGGRHFAIGRAVAPNKIAFPSDLPIDN